MSSQSASSEANEIYLSSHDGRTSTADESSARESPVAEKTEHRARKAKQAEQTSSGTEKATDDSQDPEPQSRQQMRPTLRRISRRRRDAYKKILAHATEKIPESLQDDGQPLPPSQIGASVWSSLEKEAFFAALALFGQDDLPRLRDAVQTKSLPEISAYLLLLRETTRQTKIRDKARPFNLENASASVEIHQECEDVLEDAADHVAMNEISLSIEEEKQHYGDFWLVDESVAAEIERYTVRQGSFASEDETSSDISTSGEHNAEPDAASNVKAAELLIPANLLQLSRNIFMDGPAPHNWRTTETLDHEIASAPAVWQSALDHLYELTIAKMRELVRASILQATSRLRFTDGNDYAPVVAQHDVTIAARILKLKSWDAYWATFPRRSRFHVYSENRKYKDGRPGTKNGVRLTYDEVEYELGLDVAPATATAVNPEETGEDSQSVSSSSDNISDDATESSSDSLPNPEQEEEHYLEAIDQQASHEEQRKVFNVLGLTAPQDEDVDVEIKEEPRRRPSKRKRGEVDELLMMEWRKRMIYEPEWVTRMQNSTVQDSTVQKGGV